MQEEQYFTCPFCFSEVSILVDLSIKKHQYIEDCEVCCRPIEFRIEANGIDILTFEYQGMEQ